MAGVRPAAGSIAPHGLRYLALGDSYTIGEGVADSERWPVQLARALRDDGLGVDDPQIIATTGWTTDELQAAIDRAAPTPGFDLVTLLIGVNNQYRGRPLDEYLRQFQGLLEHAIALAGGRARRVVVLSIPDWGVTPFAVASGRDVAQIAAQIDAFNREARLACQRRQVAFVDVTTVSRQQGAEAAMLVDDGLHPSGAMYRLWMQHAFPAARDALA
ncbi:SGNH/GDSL hydrolase family protein [Pseudoxanthomonas winnipegensis]|jgi:lysophospholipase L1-like esterase|uniref:SGNH/GDSL hydrolase family protein n=1 Tax=Pseudoxanthomonas winnipegensis TaxID=2480810 RepID=A0ABY1W9A6_9GAMM|nr:SGNH/GDSL hydrolase family protein [Pseudoxanthomonas winnipegensis]TAA06739.1 SGNH/GDSL hydrolase family protein [Pseudoxanthomonas winnipegensis]TAA16417.1 SGNH/GDSL hydrolase family protein [Pseudoxanthomonas winnipegensis]TAH69758.1 SGNH/GDSL hydrolase family protein [Pseudoxanthomonas winnipegensis]